MLLRRTDGSFLFIKRTDILQNKTEQSWDIPGGRIEPEEALHDALTREVKEEIGVDIQGTLPRLVNAQDIFVAAKDLHVVRLTYMLDFEHDSAITLSDEHQNFQWLTLDQTKTLSVEPFLKETLEKLSRE